MPLSLNVLALQAVYHKQESSNKEQESIDVIKQLIHELNWSYHAFCITNKYIFGNDILSRYSLTISADYYTDTMKGSIARGILVVTIDHEFFNDSKTILCDTHLDHINEQICLEQRKMFDKCLSWKKHFQRMMNDLQCIDIRRLFWWLFSSAHSWCLMMSLLRNAIHSINEHAKRKKGWLRRWLGKENE
jgi:hypothetical protein